MLWVVNPSYPTAPTKICGSDCGSDPERKVFEHMTEDSAQKEGKRKFAFWVKESTLEQVRKWYPLDNCSSQSEFIEKAIWFYVGYISSDNGSDYLPKILISTLKGILNESDNRISRILFKLAVEQAIAMNVIAATNGITKEQLRFLRGQTQTILFWKRCSRGSGERYGIPESLGGCSRRRSRSEN